VAFPDGPKSASLKRYDAATLADPKLLKPGHPYTTTGITPTA